MTKDGRFFYRAVILLWFFLIAWLYIGCAGTFSQNAYKTLKTSKATYDATLSAAGEMYQEGQIDEATKGQFIAYGTAYMEVHNEAVDALLAYQMAKPSDQPMEKEKYMALADKLAKKLASLLEYFRKVKGGSHDR
ncbi:MAG: hypothetical protein PVI90_18670 [Desulfobacteraceae bacterium]|jgi:hypothetical protein